MEGDINWKTSVIRVSLEAIRKVIRNGRIVDLNARNTHRQHRRFHSRERALRKEKYGFHPKVVTLILGQRWGNSA